MPSLTLCDVAPITYSRTQSRNLTQCDLIRQFRDTIRDSESAGQLHIACLPDQGYVLVLTAT